MTVAISARQNTPGRLPALTTLNIERIATIRGEAQALPRAFVENETLRMLKALGIKPHQAFWHRFTYVVSWYRPEEGEAGDFLRCEFTRLGLRALSDILGQDCIAAAMEYGHEFGGTMWKPQGKLIGARADQWQPFEGFRFVSGNLRRHYQPGDYHAE